MALRLRFWELLPFCRNPGNSSYHFSQVTPQGLHWQVVVLYAACVMRAQSSPALSTPWTVATQAPLSMEFSMQEYCSRLPFPSRGDLPQPGIESASLAFPAQAGGFFSHLGSHHFPRKSKRANGIVMTTLVEN